MAFIHSVLARNALANLIDDLVNNGAAVGTFQMWTLGQGAGVLIISLDMNDPAFTAAGATLDGQIDLDTTPAVNGTVGVGNQGVTGHFRLYDGDTTPAEIVSGTCNTSGADLNWNDTNLVDSADVTITSFSYRASA